MRPMFTGIELSTFLVGTVSVMKTSLPERLALIMSMPAGMRMIGASGGPFLPQAAAAKATASTASHEQRENFNTTILLFVRYSTAILRRPQHSRPSQPRHRLARLHAGGVLRRLDGSGGHRRRGSSPCS